ncbi:50S ribosomal protein L25 [Candidatus Microgenomates bacterium]|nr:50S ribosomal protein L25 [Candidatus Microgenomates bacterium]
MQSLVLDAQAREITGKKVKKIRKEGLLPASLYGKDVKSATLSVKMVDFMKVYAKAGETGLVELKYGKETTPTLIANVQIHPVSRSPLHVEFHAVNLTEKIKANVPVELLGESPAVANNVGILLQTINEVEVEALPADLPEKLTVDATKLAEIDQQVTVAELAVPKGVTVLTEPSGVVVKVAAAVSEETKKELEAEEAAKAAAAAEAAAPPAGGEGEAPVAPAEGPASAEASTGKEQKPVEPTEEKKAS